MSGGGASNTYKRNGVGPTAPVIDDGAAVYTPGISERRSGVSKWSHQDYLGSTKALTNSSETVTDTRQYDAFGLQTGSTGSNPTPFGFAGGWGYQSDETGLQLLGHRYYDPSTGRFLTRDPIKDGRNWYGYCENNPIKRVDPLGLAWIMYGIDRRGIGHAFIMIVWDNGEVWILENTLFSDKQLYKSGTKDGKKAISSFEGRADYEYWEEFDEQTYSRHFVRSLFNLMKDGYNLCLNNCTQFVSAMFACITGIWIYAPSPMDTGMIIRRKNKQGKGKRPKQFGAIGTIPNSPKKTINGGGRRRGLPKL